MDKGTADRRVRRTRQLLINALLALIVERGYEGLTVQDILDQADVGRSTFYAHFRDKDDLLHAAFARLRTLFALPAANEPHASLAALSLTLFQHTAQQRPLYQAMVGLAHALLTRALHDLLSEHVQVHLVQLGTRLPVPAEVAVEYYVSALLGLLTWWLDAPRGYTPEEMDAMFRQLVRPMLANS